MAKQIQLKDVFGISTDVTQYTYVDRNKLDDTFLYYLDTDRHIVIYGGSKQGKTILRKKHLKESESVVVSCREVNVLEDIYLGILAKLEVHIDTQITETLSRDGSIAGELEANLGLIKGKISPKKGDAKSTQTTSQPVGIDVQRLEYIAEKIRESGKRVVLEDFHYLSESQQRRLAFDLKAFWDNKVFMIIIGIWEDDNLLTYYNGDLSGRIEEIDVEWQEKELRQLLDQGSEALNIRFSGEIEDALVSDASRNVGLLQQLAEKLCFAERITEGARSPGKRPITDPKMLQGVRKRICSDLASRYRQFYEAMKKGFEENQTTTFGDIVRACAVTVSSENLSYGIDKDGLLDAIKRNGNEMSEETLQDALENLNRLQAEKRVHPMVLYVNPDTYELKLADKQFLFYRQHCQPHWN